jgi:radical SAM-linked protein
MTIFMDNVAKTRMRLRFARLENAGNMSHLEQIKALRDIAAASGLDCCPAKHGHNLVPKMSFGPALSAGYGSRCEYADLYLAQACREEVAMAKLAAVKSETFSLLSVKRVPVYFPSIEASVSAARYLIEAEFKGDFTQAAVDAFFARESAPYTKPAPAPHPPKADGQSAVPAGETGPGLTVDVRPLVMSAELDAAAGTLRLTLKVEPGRNVKPVEVLGVMAGRELEIKKVVREDLCWLDSKGRLEVI